MAGFGYGLPLSRLVRWSNSMGSLWNAHRMEYSMQGILVVISNWYPWKGKWIIISNLEQKILILHGIVMAPMPIFISTDYLIVMNPLCKDIHALENHIFYPTLHSLYSTPQHPFSFLTRNAFHLWMKIPILWPFQLYALFVLDTIDILTSGGISRKLFKPCLKTHGRNRAPKVKTWLIHGNSSCNETIDIANKDSIQLSCEFLRLFTTGNE